MHDMLHGRFSSLTDFGGKIGEEKRLWVQGESSEALKSRKEIMTKIKKGRIEVEGAVLVGRHCKIGDGARIVDSCIDNYTQIGKNAVIEKSAIMDRVIIGENAEIKDSIIGRHVTVLSNSKKPTKIHRVSVVADDVTLAEGCRLTATKIYPHQYVRGQFKDQTVMQD
jgi:NDP-sugar pyrophosphorylase family protein